MSYKDSASLFASACVAMLSTVMAAPVSHALEAPAGVETEHAEEESEAIIVQATRTGRRVQDEPVRVEVVTREEIEEKMLMRPGNIAMLVNETGGVRVQVTAPAMGAANVRVQGMNGRYTQLLADGLPLYGGQASSLGLLQIPPTDLGQVEVIKGAASALYGPSALGGVINLVSRRPGDELESEMLLNTTSHDGQDLTTYVASPLASGWSASITGGYHRQRRHDLDKDGWLDIPGFERWTARPRLFWEGESGARAFLTIGAMTEERMGGTYAGHIMPDGHQFPQTQKTDRFDTGLVAEVPVDRFGTLSLRASGMRQNHRHRFGESVDNDRHDTAFAEASFASGAGKTSWVAGLAYQADTYRSESYSAFDYSHHVPGIFAQVEHELRDDLTLAGSTRLDVHDEYGTRFSPRFSMLYRPGYWTVRATLGRGFYAPTPFVDEIEAAGLSRLAPLDDLKAEVAETASLDIGYTRGPVEAHVTLFTSDIGNAVRLEPIEPGVEGGSGRVRLVNARGPTRIRGSELLLRYRWRQFVVTGSYVYVDASEPGLTGANRRTVPLTPRHTAGVVAMWEDHDKGRIGIEAYYTGHQRLDDNPYRTRAKPYVQLGILGEIVLGNVRLFVNAENILNVRQTRYDPLILPQQTLDGRWTVDAWAPTDGFVLNGGVRISFGGH